jgi:beta-galactosidase
MAAIPRGVRFGTAFYTEYQPYERLTTDLDLMVDAGINVIRVGESVWSTWEPREGQFNLDWLAPVLDAAHERGISAIVGTPTYAVPPWLRRTYPETAAHKATGEAIPYGMRQDVDYSHPAFRHLAERLIRRIVERYRDHPAVIGWQVDNEPGHKLFYNHSVFQGFLEYLRNRYGDVETLNTRWGLTYWSHRLSEWADLWPPDGNSTPSYDLAWRRYQAELTHEFIAWQTELVRSLVPAGQYVTTCVALGQVGLDITEVGRPLDVVGTNVYYATQDGLELPGPDELTGGLYPFFVAWGGPAWLHLQADLSRGTRQQPFLVTETNATSIGGSADNFPPYAGQLRQVVWALIARGARLVEYWHWHSLHYGYETYWGGILPHSLEPGRIYHELAAVGAELRERADLIGDLRVRSDVGVLVSAESRWATEFMAPLRGAGSGWLGDPQSYDRILAAFYRGLFDVGLSTDILAPTQLPADASVAAQRWPVLVVPCLYIAADATLAALKAYAAAGGHLVLTPRTGYADDESVARHNVMPGVLREAAGVSYSEFSNLTVPVPIFVGGSAPHEYPKRDAELSGAATAWADGLIPEGATVLATYNHPHLRQFAAVTTNVFGAGRVTCVGTVPDRELSRSVAQWIAKTSLSEDAWRIAWPAPVRCMSCSTEDGRMVRFIHNWGWEPAEFIAPGDQAVSLGPWDVQILVEPGQP